jgi:hypothetical protein
MICFYTERLWNSTVTMDICSFITASHRVTNRGIEGKERVNISYGLLKWRLLCDILSCHCAVEEGLRLLDWYTYSTGEELPTVLRFVCKTVREILLSERITWNFIVQESLNSDVL